MDSAGAAPSVNAAVESPQPVRHVDFMPWRRYAVHAVIWLLIAVTFVVAFRSGWKIRRSIFDIFQPIRFLDDDTRGCYWGLVASGPEGFLNQYDKMEPQLPRTARSAVWIPWLDYAPLRLLVMRHWGFYQRKYFPPDPDQSLLSAYRTSYEFMAPPLRFNGCDRKFSRVGLPFFLTRHWVLRSRGGKPRYPFDGVWQGAAAAVILWLSPDMMISSHAWVTWDTWIVPWLPCAARCLPASIGGLPRDWHAGN